MKTLQNCSAWSDAGLRELDQTDAIAANWERQWAYAQGNPQYMQFCGEIASCTGAIIEVAAGPGGGNLSPILHLNPQANLLVNDLEPGIVERWQKFLSAALAEAQVEFCVFDVCDMPLPSSSYACISSSGGLSTMLGAHSAALRECARVLRPKGLVFAHEMVLTEKCLKAMPQALKGEFVYHPWLFRDWGKLLLGAGFNIISEETVGTRVLHRDESPLAIDADGYNAKIEVEWVMVVAARRDRNA